MDKETRAMFNAILEEMARMEERIERKMDSRFQRIENELEQLHHEVNACKLEKDAVQLLIERGDRLEERLDGHEARIVRLEEKRKKPQKKFQEA